METEGRKCYPDFQKENEVVFLKQEAVNIILILSEADIFVTFGCLVSIPAS